MTSAQLTEGSGLKKGELKVFLSMLDARGLLAERDGTAPDSFLDSIGKLGWFRRAGHAHARRPLTRPRTAAHAVSAFPWRG